MCIRCALAAVLATAIAEIPPPNPGAFIDWGRKDQPDNASSGNAKEAQMQAQTTAYDGAVKASPEKDTAEGPRHVRNEINRLLVRQEQQNAKLSAENEHLRHQLDGLRRMVEDANQHIDTMHAELRQARGAAETLKATVKILAVDSAKL